MSVRETLSKKPKLAAGVAAGMIIVACAFMFFQIRPAAGLATAGDTFYSTDDGATWFADQATKVPPFDHDGKQAVLAIVVERDGKKSVAYLQRYTKDGVAYANSVTAALANKQRVPQRPAEAGRNPFWGVEIKKPGATAWTPRSDLKVAAAIVALASQDGAVAVSP